MAYVILPKTIADPTAQDRRERGAMREFERRLKLVKKDVLALLKRQPYRVLTLNAVGAEFKRYEFNVDTITMDLIGQEVLEIAERWIVGGGPENVWFINEYVAPAYQQGTGMAYANLAAQSQVMRATYPNLVDLLSSAPYRRRLAYVRAREFEELQGFTGAMANRLSMILTDGMAQGMNPLAIARQIEEANLADINRANRIARTEITTALRRSRLDEAEEAQQDLGLLTMMMQVSALSPTTRASHAIRHAELFTIEECRIWMATSPNMINCKCTFIEVLVNKKGEPLTPGIIERARAMRPAPAPPPKEESEE
jgi:hypothetical protein